MWSLPVLQVDSTECRYLLAGAGNGVVFAYDLEGAGRAADSESKAEDALGASSHEAEANGVLEPLFSTSTVLVPGTDGVCHSSPCHLQTNAPPASVSASTARLWS